MPAHRKTLKELAETGTLQRHLATYRGRIEAQKAKDALLASGLTAPKDIKPLPKRVPGHLSKAAKAAWREIVATAPDGSLVASDALQLEITAKLLVKSRTEDLKPAAMNQLAIQLAKWGSKGQDASAVVANPSVMPASAEPETELTPAEKFFSDDDEDKRRDAMIRAEMVRRKEAGPLDGQTEKEFEYACRWSDVQKDLTTQHSWHRLYVD